MLLLWALTESSLKLIKLVCYFFKLMFSLSILEARQMKDKLTDTYFTVKKKCLFNFTFRTIFKFEGLKENSDLGSLLKLLSHSQVKASY